MELRGSEGKEWAKNIANDVRRGLVAADGVEQDGHFEDRLVRQMELARRVRHSVVDGACMCTPILAHAQTRPDQTRLA